MLVAFSSYTWMPGYKPTAVRDPRAVVKKAGGSRTLGTAKDNMLDQVKPAV